MGEVTVYECDHCGDRFGAKNDVETIPVRRRPTDEPFHVHEYDVHLCMDAFDDSPNVSPTFRPNSTYIAVEHDDVVGMRPKNDQYRERGNVVIDHYESFFAWFEDEVIV